VETPEHHGFTNRWTASFWKAHFGIETLTVISGEIDKTRLTVAPPNAGTSVKKLASWKSQEPSSIVPNISAMTLLDPRGSMKLLPLLFSR
jgi:hypothetical protein